MMHPRGGSVFEPHGLVRLRHGPAGTVWARPGSRSGWRQFVRFAVTLPNMPTS